jgi:hypothetical protein
MEGRRRRPSSLDSHETLRKRNLARFTPEVADKSAKQTSEGVRNSMSAHEIAEHIEHAAHGGGHGGEHKGPARYIGITMAILGVMVAFSSAMVGAERTELITSLVEQSQRFGFYQTETMKFRAMDANFELLKALSPHQDEITKIENTLRAKRGAGGHADDEDTAELKDLIASSTEDLADLLTPDREVITGFKKQARLYEHDMKEAKEDAEAYEGAIAAHRTGTEGYEHALLAAEIGIVVASVALLMSSRVMWLLAVVLGLVCAGESGITFARTRSQVVAAEHKIEEAAKNVQKIENDDDQSDVDADGDKAKAGSAAPKPSEKPSEPAEKH